MNQNFFYFKGGNNNSVMELIQKLSQERQQLLQQQLELLLTQLSPTRELLTRERREQWLGQLLAPLTRKQLQLLKPYLTQSDYKLNELIEEVIKQKTK